MIFSETTRQRKQYLIRPASEYFFQFLIQKSKKLCWTVKEERCLLSNFSGNNLKWELWTRFKSMRNLKKVFLATSSHKFLRFRWTNRSQEFFLLFLEKFDFLRPYIPDVYREEMICKILIFNGLENSKMSTTGLC